MGRWSAAHTKPTSSRAIAITAWFGGLRRLEQFPIAPVQPLLRLVRERDDRAPVAPRGASERGAHARSVAVVPGGFDEEAPDMGVAGLGDAAAPVALGTAVLARHQAEVGHQLPRRREAPEAMQLGDDGQRGDRVDAAEAAQPATGSA